MLAKLNDADIISLTETGINKPIQDSVLTVHNFILCRKHRVAPIGDGVGIYLTPEFNVEE